MTNKSICIFTGYYYPHFGGVEKYTISIARELVQKGFRVLIVTNNTENVDDFEKIDGIEIIRLPVFKLFRNRYPLLNIFKRKFLAN